MKLISQWVPHQYRVLGHDLLQLAMEAFFKKWLGSTKVGGIHYDNVKPQRQRVSLRTSQGGFSRTDYPIITSCFYELSTLYPPDFTILESKKPLHCIRPFPTISNLCSKSTSCVAEQHFPPIAHHLPASSERDGPRTQMPTCHDNPWQGFQRN